jgi:hypothetical protein
VQPIEDTASRAPEVDRSYSAILLGLGLVHLLGSFSLAASAQSLPAARFPANILLLVGAVSLVAAVLRWLRLPISVPVTVAASSFLIFSFPLGTAAFVYWIKKVRPRELKEMPEAERASFRYTVGLYVAGLLLCLTALVFHSMIDTAPSNGRSTWEIFRLAFFVAALLLVAVGVLRSLKRPVSYVVTLILNVLLILYLPLGTCFALFWFLAVRKHDLFIYRVQAVP